MESIDEIIRAAAQVPLQKTPEPLPSDDTSSGRNWFDSTTASIKYHDDKERRKYTKEEFPGMVLRVLTIKDKEELEGETSPAFASHILKGNSVDNSKKIWKLFVHVPNRTSFCPFLPSYQEIKTYRAGEMQGFEKLLYEKRINRMSKFYCISSTPPKIMDLWNISYPDENFSYYGKAISLHSPAGAIMRKVSGESPQYV